MNNNNIDKPYIDEETIELIATKVADKITDKVAEKVTEKVEGRFYQRVGKGFIEKVFQFLGVIAVALFFYLESKGWLKL